MNDQNKEKNSMILPIAVVVLIIAVFAGMYMKQKGSSSMSNGTSQTPTSAMAKMYKDGMYTADGNYVSPGGPRDVSVSVTLANGIITDSTFEAKATDATSTRFQKEFTDNYKQMVVGKSIDEVNLTKVSGSSLTPKGFNDALTKIKTEAKS